MKSDVDSQANKLRVSYHQQLDRLQREMSNRYNEMIRNQMEKFTNVLRTEITSKLPKDEDMDRDMEIRALHAQIDAVSRVFFYGCILWKLRILLSKIFNQHYFANTFCLPICCKI